LKCGWKPEICNMQKRYGFGIIGAGMIAHVHARAIKEIEKADLIGVFSTTKSKREAFAAKESCTAYNSLEDMLADERIQVVCICTPSGAHQDPALACLNAGKHCMVEKPLEVTLEKCDRIISKAKEKDLKLGVIFPSRFYDHALRLKSAMTSGKFGEIVLGDAYVKWHRSDAYYLSNAWRGTWELDGGGALMNQGIHSVDLLQWYMGPVESVQAFAGNRRHKGIAVEDTVVAVLRFANGAMGNIECSTAIFPGELKRIEINGTVGTAVLQESQLTRWEFLEPLAEDLQLNEEMKTSGLNHGGGASNPADISFVGHQRQLEDFIHAIAKNGSPLVDGVEGRKSVEIVLAIYESAKTGKLVSLNS
jgi:UDP-N-acetyl-2-amino-2-deoxyglucuronate dehydrogenase